MLCFRTGMGEYIFIRSLTQTFPKPETRCLLHKYGVVIERFIRVSSEPLIDLFWIFFMLRRPVFHLHPSYCLRARLLRSSCFPSMDSHPTGTNKEDNKNLVTI